MPDRLLEARLLIPGAPAGCIARPRLADVLADAVTRPVTVVCAPAGSGKSVLISSWARDRPSGSVAWMTCDPFDSGPVRFWRYVLTAAARADPVRGDELLAGARSSALGADPRGSVQALLAWATDRDAATALAIVIDDLHAVRDPATYADLQYLIDRLPPALSLILIGRADPPLALQRVRMDDRLGEIRSDHMAFTQSELDLLLIGNQVPLSPPQQHQLLDRTAGWAAGLRFAILSLRRQGPPEPTWSLLTTTSGNVASYLIEEVLDQLDIGDYDFLLSVCIVDELQDDLAQALCNRTDAAERLEALAASIGFITATAGAGTTVYRLHPLFLGLLRNLLTHRHSDRVDGLHRSAAAWYAEQHQPVLAVEHLQQASSWDEAAGLLLRLATGIIMRGEMTTVTALVHRFPAEFRSQDPRLMVLRAQMCALSGDAAGCQSLLDRLVAKPPPNGEPGPSGWADFRGALGLTRIFAARLRGDFPAALAVATIDRPDDIDPDPYLRDHAVAWNASLSVAQLWTGDIAGAAATARKVAAMVRQGAAGWSMMTVLGVQSLALAIRGHLSTAEQSISELREFVADRGWSATPQVALTDVAAAWIALERLDLPEAELLLQHAEEAMVSISSGGTRAALGIARARLLLLQGAGPAAARHRLATGFAAAPGLRAPVLVQVAAFVEIEIALSCGDLDTAKHGVLGADRSDALRAYVQARAGQDQWDSAPGSAALDPAVLDPAGDRGLRMRTALAAAVQAWKHGTPGRGRAGELLDEVLDLAADEGFRLPFAQQGQDARELLTLVEGSTPRRRRTAAALLSELPARAGPVADLVEALTPSEVRVLRHLGVGQTPDEIADELFLSRNTVKTHIQSAYRKLAVTTRREAVVRARTYGLL